MIIRSWAHTHKKPLSIVLACLEFIDHLAHRSAIASSPRIGHLSSLPVLFGYREQSIARAFLGQGGFAAADQPLAEVTGSSYMGEVVLIEQRQLDRR
jgi:hypothetical protein